MRVRSGLQSYVGSPQCLQRTQKLCFVHKPARVAQLSPMDKYLVKRSSRSGEAESVPLVKRQRANEWGQRDPQSVVAWNCNGLTVRLSSRDDAAALLGFVEDHQPHVFCLSEVRLPAHCLSSNAKRGDGLPRVRHKIAQNNKKQQADKSLLDKLLSSPVFSCYKPYFSLADYKYAGTAIFVKQSMVLKPLIVRYNLDAEAPAEQHDVEGRVIYMEWESLAVLHTYSPNNGWNEKGFKRRRKWDASVKDFLINRRANGVQAMWCGDLNVAPLDIDLSHPVYYKRQFAGDGPRPPSEYIGQPGCTPAERNSFAEILKASGSLDLFREHVTSNLAADVNGPYYSWRGGNPGKHYGRGMRIDHFVGPKLIGDRVESIEICGRGIEREGFLGSDHSPIIMRLKEDKNRLTVHHRDS